MNHQQATRCLGAAALTAVLVKPSAPGAALDAGMPGPTPHLLPAAVETFLPETTGSRGAGTPPGSMTAAIGTAPANGPAEETTP